MQDATARDFTVLFWNVYKRDLGDALLDVIADLDADFVVLCEAEKHPYEAKLSSVGFSRVLDPAFADRQKVQFFNAQTVTASPALAVDPRFGVFRLTADHLDFLLVAVHLLDQGTSEEWDRHILAARVCESIEETESRLHNDRTLVIGDFNMNPYDAGMYSAKMFNARACRKEISRQKGGTDRKKPFYNPLWNLLGDKTEGPPGSYYYSGGDLKWQTLDQILVRPALADHLVRYGFVTKAKGTDLLTQEGLPNKDKFSDHLPLFAKFNFGVKNV